MIAQLMKNRVGFHANNRPRRVFQQPLAIRQVIRLAISYQATSFTYAASLGSTALDSCPTQNPVCIEVSITFVASTTTIVPFNVTGATGFENFVGQGSVTLFDDQTGQSASANFLSGQIFVSVDQTNGGVGFGSGTNIPIGCLWRHAFDSLHNYNLATAMTLFNGFAWFCPAGTCTLGVAGPGFATDQGALSITPTGPVLGSSFTATVIQVTPEPSAMLLFATAVATLARSVRRRW
jgi:hypothetical protein